MSTVMTQLVDNIPAIPIEMRATIEKASTHTTRLPQLFVLLFGIWTNCIQIPMCPMRGERFMQKLDKECMKMLTGSYVNINDFITNTLTEYII
tara:strand:- start:3208 stop:3486 length:279 start_codon:yes stop_codon:yes gene_type:complete